MELYMFVKYGLLGLLGILIGKWILKKIDRYTDKPYRSSKILRELPPTQAKTDEVPPEDDGDEDNERKLFEKVSSKTTEDENMETYEIDYVCDNCGYNHDEDADSGRIEIPKGTKAMDYLKTKLCENCGCVILDSEGFYRNLPDAESDE